MPPTATDIAVPLEKSGIGCGQSHQQDVSVDQRDAAVEGKWNSLGALRFHLGTVGRIISKARIDLRL